MLRLCLRDVDTAGFVLRSTGRYGQKTGLRQAQTSNTLGHVIDTHGAVPKAYKRVSAAIPAKGAFIMTA